MSSDIQLILLGWLLGLVSGVAVPSLTDWIRRQRERKHASVGLRTELVQFRSRLAWVYYETSRRYGGLDSEDLKWVSATLEADSARPEVEAHIAGLRRLADSLPNNFAPLLAERATGTNRVVSLRKEQLPFFDAQVHLLDRFSDDTRGLLLAIRTQLTFYNDIIEEWRDHYRLSFTVSQQDPRKESIPQNVKRTSERLAELARDLADLIGRVRL